MTPDKNSLPIIESQVFLLPASAESKHSEKTEHFQFSRVPVASGRKPEADRKADLHFFVLLQLRKLPEGVAEAYMAAVVLRGSRKVPGRSGRRTRKRTGRRTIV